MVNHELEEALDNLEHIIIDHYLLSTTGSERALLVARKKIIDIYNNKPIFGGTQHVS